MFVEGDKVLYPHHGAAVVESVVEREVAGEPREYLTLRIRGLTLMVPAESVKQVGLREVARPHELDAIFHLLRQPEGWMPELWSQRYKANLEKVVSGDIERGAEVIRDLSCRERRRGISSAEKRLLLKARDILISELTFALDLTPERAEAMLDEALAEPLAADEVRVAALAPTAEPVP